MVNNVYENYILYGNLDEIILSMNGRYCKTRSPNFSHICNIKQLRSFSLWQLGVKEEKSMIYLAISNFYHRTT